MDTQPTLGGHSPVLPLRVPPHPVISCLGHRDPTPRLCDFLLTASCPLPTRWPYQMAAWASVGAAPPLGPWLLPFWRSAPKTDIGPPVSWFPGGSQPFLGLFSFFLQEPLSAGVLGDPF